MFIRDSRSYWVCGKVAVQKNYQIKIKDKLLFFLQNYNWIIKIRKNETIVSVICKLLAFFQTESNSFGLFYMHWMILYKNVLAWLSNQLYHFSQFLYKIRVRVPALWLLSLYRVGKKLVYLNGCYLKYYIVFSS